MVWVGQLILFCRALLECFRNRCPCQRHADQDDGKLGCNSCLATPRLVGLLRYPLLGVPLLCRRYFTRCWVPRMLAEGRSPFVGLPDLLLRQPPKEKPLSRKTHRLLGYPFSHWLSGWPKKSPNFLFATKMVSVWLVLAYIWPWVKPRNVPPVNIPIQPLK